MCRRDPARDPEVISKVGNMWFNPRMPGQPSRKRTRDTHAEPAEDAMPRKRKLAQEPSPPRKTAAEKTAERAAQKQAAALERAALPAWLPATVVDALQRALQGPQDQPQQVSDPFPHSPCHSLGSQIHLISTVHPASSCLSARRSLLCLTPVKSSALIP